MLSEAYRDIVEEMLVVESDEIETDAESGFVVDSMWR